MQQIEEESIANMDLAIIEARLKELDATRALLLAMKAAQQPNPTEHKGEAGVVGEKAVEKVQAAGGGGSLKRKHRAGRDKDARRNKYKWSESMSARKAASKGGKKSGNDERKNEKEEKEKWKKSRGQGKKSGYRNNKKW